MKNLLLIFDEHIDAKECARAMRCVDIGSVTIFPLTSERGKLDKIRSVVYAKNYSSGAHMIESASLIDGEVDRIRNAVTLWSAQFGEHIIDGRSLREWFVLPKTDVSSWWFSLVSEKNTLKTDIFFKLAQLNAIDKILLRNSFEVCVFSVADNNLALALDQLCKRHSMATLRVISADRREGLLKRNTKYLFKQTEKPYLMMQTLRFLFVSVLKAIAAKFVMGPKKNRRSKAKDAILFISYFPAVDEQKAREGVLKNKYTAPLQEKLSQLGRKIAWIWMYVFLDGHTFGGALKLASSFKKNNEIGFFLEEFISPRLVARVLALWLRQVRIFTKLDKNITGEVLYKNISIPEGAVLTKNLVRESFIGRIGLEGILYFELYKEVFSRFPGLSHCIYYSEMHAWEKALNAAKHMVAPEMKSIGFQHTVVSENFFHYFYHPDELLKENSLPLPSILACNGDVSLRLLRQCGYPHMRKVEAIRHLYLEKYLNNLEFLNKRDVVLIAGSIDRDETKTLISFFYEAFPDPERFEVWLKGHPSVPLQTILDELGIRQEGSNYIVKHDPIHELLRTVSVSFVGSSTVALEALAFGSAVIVPVFSDHMFMSPLKGFEKYYLKVANPPELRAAVQGALRNREGRDRDDIKNFISNYWCLDKSMRRWEEILA